ncbi:MAG TPA: hypothetical protein PLW90_00645 [Smithellaceae bacterium]|nr:hypothetical protein [Smithellaceae bacterium]
MKPMGNLFASKVFEGLRESAGIYGDDQALLHLGAVLLRTAEAWSAFEDFIARPHPATDKGKHKLEVEAKAKKLWEKFIKEREEAQDRLALRYAEIETKIEERLGVKHAKERPLEAMEIRTSLKGISRDERVTRLQQAIANNDTSIMGAVFSNHAFISGFTEGQYRQYRQSAALKNAPEEMKLKAVLNHADELLSSQFGRIQEGIQGVTNKSVNRLADAADKASERLSKALA